MDEKIVDAVEEAVFQAYTPPGSDLAPLVNQPSGFHEYIGRIARAAIEAHTAALAEAGMVIEQGWRPIETAPQDATVVDLWSDWGRIANARWNPRDNRWIDGLLCPIATPETITHWRPLPAAPDQRPI